MKNKVNYLFKNVLLFTISSFVPKVLAFFLIPIYTSCLSTGEYGIFDLIITTATLLIPIFTLDIQDAVLIFSMDKKQLKEDVLSISLKINVRGIAVVSIITIIMSALNIFQIDIYYFLFFIIYYSVTALSNSFVLFCKGIEQVKTIVKSTIINSIITLSLNIVLLKALYMGIIGYLIANSVGMIIALVFIFVDAKLYKYVKKENNKNLQKEMIKFSFPLIFSVIAWWINNASDRYILTWLAGVSVSGLYAISYKIPSLLTIFQNIFSQAWSISAIKDFDPNDTDGFVGKIYTMINFLLCFICSLIMISNVFIAKILYNGDFFNAWKYVPPLLLSVVFNAMALFIGSIFTAVKDTKTLSITTIIGAVLNTIFNFILITLFSAYGAALATAIGYFVVLLMRNVILKKHIKMKTNNFKNYFCYVLLIIQVVFAYFGNTFIILQTIIPCIIVVIYQKSIKDILKYIQTILESKFKKAEV